VALARGMRVLSARPNSAETSLSFAGLAHLLDGIGPEVLGGLPAPQRRALEVALLRADWKEPKAYIRIVPQPG
jgi:hypothetical protein